VKFTSYNITNVSIKSTQHTVYPSRTRPYVSGIKGQLPSGLNYEKQKRGLIKTLNRLEISITIKMRIYCKNI